MLRRIIVLLVASALAVTAGCAQPSSSAPSGNAGGASASGGKSLTVFISGDTNVRDLWEKTLIPAFEKANPGFSVKVDLDLHGQHDSQTMAKLTSATAQQKSPGFDLVDAGFVSSASKANLLTPVSSSNLSALGSVPADLVKAGGDGGIPYRASSVLLAYNTKTVPSPPKTLTDLLAWIKTNPGKFTYNTPDSGGSGQAFVTTVLDQFVPAADRKKMVVGYDAALESTWKRGFTTLAGLNPFVYQKGVYPNGNNQVLDLLSSGQISLAPVWSDQFITGQKNGSVPASIAYTQIANPPFTGGAAYLGIPKTSSNQKGALALANFVLSPPAQQRISNAIAGYPVIKLSTLPASVQAKFKKADINNLRPTYYSQMNQDLNKQWAQNVPGK